jgi:hypothetical protein
MASPDGMKIEYGKMSEDDRKSLDTRVAYLRAHSKTFNSMWESLVSSDHTHTLHLDPKQVWATVAKGAISSQGNDTDIYVGLGPAPEEEIGVKTSNEVAIAHEVCHAWRFDKGLEGNKYLQNLFENALQNSISEQVYELKKSTQREQETTHIENIIRAEIDPTGETLPLRKIYGRMGDGSILSYRIFAKGTKYETWSNVPGTIPNYNYYNSSQNHYEGLQKRKNIGKISE